MKTLKQRQIETGRTLALNGKAWRNLRTAVLNREPLCRMCKRVGWAVQATDVDHHDNDPSNNDASNLIPLCHECHSRKTQADMGKAVNWGCDIHGMPLDPNDPWHESRDPLLAMFKRWKSPATDSPEPPPFLFFNANPLP